jgi:DNA-binding NarL/FixJ family response regulator
VTFVGTDEARLGRVRGALRGTDLSVTGQLSLPADAVRQATRPPDVAVLDASALDVDQAIGGIATLDAAWPESCVVVIHDDTDPAVVRSILDAGALSLVPTTTSDRQLAATLEAATEGHGLIDVDMVRPVIDLYATLHAESRRRNRASSSRSPPRSRPRTRSPAATSRPSAGWPPSSRGRSTPASATSDDFLFGCLLHDVGKIGVPEKILMKPGSLTPTSGRSCAATRRPARGSCGRSAWATWSPTWSCTTTSAGTAAGYPDGLAAEEIPLAARVFSVCDALEAMTADRPYRGPMPAKMAFERVRLESGQQFDPEVIDALERCVDNGDIDLFEEGGLEIEQPRRRRISSGSR